MNNEESAQMYNVSCNYNEAEIMLRSYIEKKAERIKASAGNIVINMDYLDLKSVLSFIRDILEDGIFIEQRLTELEKLKKEVG